MTEPKTQPPAWFQNALAHEPKMHRIGTSGQQLSVRSWHSTQGANDDTKTPLLLLHGWLAHARWFDFIAPLLLSDNFGPVYALDMPGMGDSDHFAAYQPETYINAVLDTITELELAKPALVAHSFGALVGVMAAEKREDLVSGLIVADSPFRLEPENWSGEKPMRGRFYSTKQEAMARFKLVPDQKRPADYIMDYVAETSLKETEQGWRWKFDWNRSLNSKASHEAWETAFSRFEGLRIPKAFIYAAQSRYCDPVWNEKAKVRLKASNPNDRTLFTQVDDAEHHLMLDQPLAFVRAVHQVLADLSIGGSN